MKRYGVRDIPTEDLQESTELQDAQSVAAALAKKLRLTERKLHRSNAKLASVEANATRLRRENNRQTNELTAANDKNRDLRSNVNFYMKSISRAVDSHCLDDDCKCDDGMLVIVNDATENLGVSVIRYSVKPLSYDELSKVYDGSGKSLHDKLQDTNADYVRYDDIPF